MRPAEPAPEKPKTVTMKPAEDKPKTVTMRPTEPVPPEPVPDEAAPGKPPAQATVEPAPPPKKVEEAPAPPGTKVPGGDTVDMLCPMCDSIVTIPVKRPIHVKCPKCSEEYYFAR